jgi:hypothetical protein
MGHDATKMQMGTTASNVKEVTNRAGDASTLRAGLVVRLKSDDTLSVAKADGSILGVSLGKDLSDAGRVAIVRKGLGVPVLLTNGFTPTKGAQVAISDTTGKAKAYTGTGDSYVNAFYASGSLTAVKEDGTNEADGCALVDMAGGL